MAGIATFTIVVSSRIMKNPVVKTTSTSHGLVRACAMPSPQHFMPGIDSGLPLQSSFLDLELELADPFALCFEHRDLVLQLDERQPGYAGCSKLTHDMGQLFRLGGKGGNSLAKELCCLLSLEVMHEHEAGREIGVLASWSRQDLAYDLDEQFPAGFGELVDGPFWSAALLLTLDGHHQPVALENLDRVVERAEVQPDELVVMALAHRRRELIGMHRPLVEKLKD